MKSKEFMNLVESALSTLNEKTLKGTKKREEPFVVVAIKNNKVIDQFAGAEYKELGDVVTYMKSAHKNATISIENNKGKVVEVIKEHIELDEDHMRGKEVIVFGKKGVVVKEIGSDGDTENDEIYQVKFEDGTVKNIPARDMEMQSDKREPSENEAEDIVMGEERKSVYNVPDALDILRNFNMGGKGINVPSINNEKWGTPGFLHRKMNEERKFSRGDYVKGRRGNHTGNEYVVHSDDSANPYMTVRVPKENGNHRLVQVSRNNFNRVNPGYKKRRFPGPVPKS